MNNSIGWIIPTYNDYVDFRFGKIIVQSLLYFSIAWISSKQFRDYLSKIVPPYNNDGVTNDSPIIKIPPEVQFKQNATRRFLDTFGRDNISGLNSNIDSVFYVKQDYLEAIKDENNELEQKWKQRILMEFVPGRGNVIMYYNPYKGGFAYYSDQTMPYAYLNAIAMKYAIMYRCRDFFLYEQHVPAN